MKNRILILAAALVVFGAGCIPSVSTLLHRTEGCGPYGCLPDEPPPTVDPNTGRVYQQPVPGPAFDPNAPDPNAPSDVATGPPPVPGGTPPTSDPNEPPLVGTGDPPVPPGLSYRPESWERYKCEWVPSCYVDAPSDHPPAGQADGTPPEGRP